MKEASDSKHPNVLVLNHRTDFLRGGIKKYEYIKFFSF